MRLDFFLQPFVVAFALTSVFCLVFLLVPVFRHRVWRQGQRHGDKVMLSRLGGVALCAGFLGAVLLDTHLVISRDIVGLLVGGIFITAFGLWDDFRELTFKAQGFFQVAITTILFIFGIRITSLRNPFGTPFLFTDENVFSILIGFLLLLLWMVLVLNAVNWLDGLDGLLGSVSLFTFFTVFLLSLKPEVNQPPVAILAIIGSGAVAGFLFFNIHPARLLAGTSGSLFVGFVIAVLSVIAGTKIATALLVLALPVADSLFVIGERLLARVSIFQSDERHLHYKLRRLGWSEGRIVWFFATFTGLIALMALSTEQLSKFLVGTLIFSVLFIFLTYVAIKTRALGSKNQVV
ncbi:MAG: undecaprenyl/decaprenyl-phosphate alpha-N-acetylglucosaminyl 1-phosphate transferase [Candidatus Moranbacteria bacterium]|nr:undecaprenyl/decaprenyl-phosphate alpha-N-acetylglucosaminyl 1-phosphate transferase [Candidatus Moranbacteria bacterium]